MEKGCSMTVPIKADRFKSLVSVARTIQTLELKST